MKKGALKLHLQNQSEADTSIALFSITFTVYLNYELINWVKKMHTYSLDSWLTASKISVEIANLPVPDVLLLH